MKLITVLNLFQINNFILWFFWLNKPNFEYFLFMVDIE